MREGAAFPAKRGFTGLTGYSAAELSDGRGRMVHPEERPGIESLLSGEPAKGASLRLDARDEDLPHNFSDIVHIHFPESGRVLYLNPSFSRLSGYRAQNWLGRSAEDLVPPPDPVTETDLAELSEKKGIFYHGGNI